MLFIVAFNIYIKPHIAMIIKYITQMINCQEVSKISFGMTFTSRNNRIETDTDRIYALKEGDHRDRS